VDANFIRLSQILLESPVYHALATHDEAMIAAAKSFAKQRGIDPSRFEFQMLYGVAPRPAAHLVREGYNVRVYVPFGREWYPYFMRRLAERPANALFLGGTLPGLGRIRLTLCRRDGHHSPPTHCAKDAQWMGHS